MPGTLHLTPWQEDTEITTTDFTKESRQHHQALFATLGTTKHNLQRSSTSTKFCSRSRARHEPTHNRTCQRTQRYLTQFYMPSWVGRETACKRACRKPTKPWSSACRPGHDENCPSTTAISLKNRTAGPTLIFLFDTWCQERNGLPVCNNHNLFPDHGVREE